MANYTAEQVKSFKDAVAAANRAADALLKVEAHKLDEGSDKFLRIRAVRIEHLHREVLEGKSKRS
jgi:hypothetical protein